MSKKGPFGVKINKISGPKGPKFMLYWEKSTQTEGTTDNFAWLKA